MAMNMSTTPTPQTISLNAATRLHTVTTDGFKTARMSVYTQIPLDAVHSPQITLLFSVMSRGAGPYESMAALNRRLDELYGTAISCRNARWGDKQCIGFSAEMMEDAFLPAEDTKTDILGGTVDILAQLLLHPLTDAHGCLRAQIVEKQKSALCDSLRAELNHPRTRAELAYHRHLFAGEPCALSPAGTVDALCGITPQAVTDAWHDFLRQARVEILYVGRVAPEKVAERWRTALAGWTPAGLEDTPSTPHRAPAALRYVTEDMEASQGWLCMGWSPSEPLHATDKLALQVCSQWLGEMPSSRLYRHVREQLGLCYTCESGFDDLKQVLTVTCGLRPDRRAEAEAAIQMEWETLWAGRVPKQDLALALASLTNEYRQIQDNVASLEHYWCRRILRGERQTPEDMLAALQNITLEDMCQSAQRMQLDTVYFLRGCEKQGMAGVGTGKGVYDEYDAYDPEGEV